MQSEPHHHLIENLPFPPCDSWTITELALSNNHSLTIYNFLKHGFKLFLT